MKQSLFSALLAAALLAGSPRAGAYVDFAAYVSKSFLRDYELRAYTSDKDWRPVTDAMTGVPLGERHFGSSGAAVHALQITDKSQRSNQFYIFFVETGKACTSNGLDQAKWLDFFNGSEYLVYTQTVKASFEQPHTSMPFSACSAGRTLTLYLFDPMGDTLPMQLVTYKSSQYRAADIPFCIYRGEY